MRLDSSSSEVESSDRFIPTRMKDISRAKFEACDLNTLEFNRLKSTEENIALNDQENEYSNIWGTKTPSAQVFQLPLNTQAATVACMTSADNLDFYEQPELSVEKQKEI